MAVAVAAVAAVAAVVETPHPPSGSWTIRHGTQVIVTSTEQNFSHTFRDPGFYEVELIATNCAGSDTATQILEIIDVIEPEPDVFLVPSAVHTPGLNQTLWKTDLRIFNPGDRPGDGVHRVPPREHQQQPDRGPGHRVRISKASALGSSTTSSKRFRASRATATRGRSVSPTARAPKSHR